MPLDRNSRMPDELSRSDRPSAAIVLPSSSVASIDFAQIAWHLIDAPFFVVPKTPVALPSSSTTMKARALTVFAIPAPESPSPAAPIPTTTTASKATAPAAARQRRADRSSAATLPASPSIVAAAVVGSFVKFVALIVGFSKLTSSAVVRGSTAFANARRRLYASGEPSVAADRREKARFRILARCVGSSYAVGCRGANFDERCRSLLSAVERFAVDMAGGKWDIISIATSSLRNCPRRSRQRNSPDALRFDFYKAGSPAAMARDSSADPHRRGARRGRMPTLSAFSKHPRPGLRLFSYRRIAV